MLTKLRRWALFNGVLWGGVFALSGAWTSALLWSFALGMAGLTLYAMTAVAPDLGKERFRPPTRGADATALIWIRLTAFGALVVSSLDGGRLHWSPPIPDAIRAAAMAGALAAFAFCFRAMVANRFFSAVIRIQDDRGHRVVDSGPYAVIRHAGYAGMITGVPLMAIGLGSWWGCAIACAYSLLIGRRVMFEDRFLRANLPGYSEYAGRVRSRLVPGVW